jgi:hypothetical protein
MMILSCYILGNELDGCEPVCKHRLIHWYYSVLMVLSDKQLDSFTIPYSFLSGRRQRCSKCGGYFVNQQKCIDQKPHNTRNVCQCMQEYLYHLNKQILLVMKLM